VHQLGIDRGIPQITASTARRSIARRFNSSAEKPCAFAETIANSNTIADSIDLFIASPLRSCDLLSRRQAPLHLLHDLIDAEARWALARRVFLKGREELPYDRLCGY
jgi:hypothetical protein